jgi:TonB-dependent starch-binding outer membrane protein SusC
MSRSHRSRGRPGLHLTRYGAAGLVLTFLLCLPAHVLAQGTINVNVTEFGTQRPLSFVQVFIQGTTIGGLTNARGQATLPNLPAGTVQLRAELIGYAGQTREVTVIDGQTASVGFELRQSALALDQIVVTGAGVATERRKLGNTIATIDASQLQNAPVSNLSEMLSGREPGVVGLASGGMTGEGSRLRIRGSASLSQSNEPVVYVDGVRVDNAGGFGPNVGAGGGGAPSRLDDLNPDAIERIEILKGAAAATLYGTQASNGVIQIFTKRGQSGAPRYDVSIEQSAIQPQLGRLKPHAGYVLGTDPQPRAYGRNDLGTTGVQQFWGLNVQPYEVFELDLFPELFGTGRGQTYSLSVTGGTSAATYFVSARVHDEDGPYDGSSFQAPGFQVANDENRRMQFNANVELLPRDNLRIRVSSGYTEMTHETVDNNNNIFGVLSSLINSRPESASASNGFGSPAFGTTRENFHRRTSQDVQRYGGSVTTVYQARPNLALDATVGIDFVNQRAVRFLPFLWNVDQFAAANVTGTRTASDRNHREVTLDVKGTWATAFGEDWTSEFLFGGQGFLTRTQSQSGTGSEFPGPGLEVASAGALQTIFENFTEEVNVGLLAQNQLGFRNYAFFTVGGRYDRHSAFGETAGGAFYPKASLSVVPSQLPGWDSPTFSTLRVRGAVGTSGLQPGAFDQFTTFAPLASTEGAGVAPANLGNPNLKPETSIEWEMGAEVGVFQDRASLEFTYWNRTVNDVLVDRQFAPSGGFRFRQLDNIGEMKAWGLEFGASALAVARPNFSATLFANAAFLREEITDLGGAPSIKVGGSYPRYRQFIREGYAPGAFFGPILDTSVEFPVHLGNCQPLSRAELEAYLSVPRNPTVLQPYVLECGTPEMLLNPLGKPVPDWQGSFGTSMSMFQNWSLNALFEYRFGNFFIHDLDGAFRRSHFLIGRNVREAAEVEATLLNPNSSVQERVAAADRWVRELQALSPYDGLNEIHEADWLRFRELGLSYRVPSTWADRFRASTLTVSGAVRNLALWTKFPGSDPELTYSSRSATGSLDDNFGDGTVSWGVPLPRRFTFAIRASF